MTTIKTFNAKLYIAFSYAYGYWLMSKNWRCRLIQKIRFYRLNPQKFARFGLRLTLFVGAGIFIGSGLPLVGLICLIGGLTAEV